MLFSVAPPGFLRKFRIGVVPLSRFLPIALSIPPRPLSVSHSNLFAVRLFPGTLLLSIRFRVVSELLTAATVDLVPVEAPIGVGRVAPARLAMRLVPVASPLAPMELG